MQTTADPATGTPAGEAFDPLETRPVRLLVPAKRRNQYWMSMEDTLHASDLGITRHTDDDDLGRLVRQARRIPDLADDPAKHLRRMRDALRCPRDLDEAKEWGFDVSKDIVTEHENGEEFSSNPSDRLGWYWLYEPEQVETRAERAERYYSDERLIDMKGFARCTLRAYITVKDAKNEGEKLRRMIAEDEYLEEQALKYLAKELGEDATISPALLAQTKSRMLARAKKTVLKAMPEPRSQAGQSPLWQVRDAMRNGRLRTQLDDWFGFNVVKQTGRPQGSTNRPKFRSAAAPAV